MRVFMLVSRPLVASIHNRPLPVSWQLEIEPCDMSFKTYDTIRLAVARVVLTINPFRIG